MVNKVILIGALGKDPELKYTNGGTAICNLSLATSEKRKDQNDKWIDETEWHKITVWGNQAESCNKYLSKGRKVYIEGKIKTRSWDDQNGNKRYITEIHAREVKFLGGDGNNQSKGSTQSRNTNTQQKKQQNSYPPDDFDKIDPDDIPF